MCAGPRNMFIEEAEQIKIKHHVSEGEKISTVRLADITKNMKLDLSRPEFLETVFDNYAVTDPEHLTVKEFVLILKHIVELDTTCGFPIKQDPDDGTPERRSLLLRHETIPDEHVIRSRESTEVKLKSDTEISKINKLNKKIDRRAYKFAKNIYKSMGLKPYSIITKEEFVTKFQVRYYCNALKVS